MPRLERNNVGSSPSAGSGWVAPISNGSGGFSLSSPPRDRRGVPCCQESLCRHWRHRTGGGRNRSGEGLSPPNRRAPRARRTPGRTERSRVAARILNRRDGMS